jgi:hypothetical protein
VLLVVARGAAIGGARDVVAATAIVGVADALFYGIVLAPRLPRTPTLLGRADVPAAGTARRRAIAWERLGWRSGGARRGRVPARHGGARLASLRPRARPTVPRPRCSSSPSSPCCRCCATSP